MRVIERTQSGGHYVQPAEVDRNFEGNLLMLDKHFSILDHVCIVDTSLVEHRILVTISPDESKQWVSYKSLPTWFSQYMPGITRKVFYGEEHYPYNQ